MNTTINFIPDTNMIRNVNEICIDKYKYLNDFKEFCKQINFGIPLKLLYSYFIFDAIQFFFKYRFNKLKLETDHVLVDLPFYKLTTGDLVLFFDVGKSLIIILVIIMLIYQKNLWVI